MDHTVIKVVVDVHLVFFYGDSFALNLFLANRYLLFEEKEKEKKNLTINTRKKPRQVSLGSKKINDVITTYLCNVHTTRALHCYPPLFPDPFPYPFLPAVIKNKQDFDSFPLLKKEVPGAINDQCRHFVLALVSLFFLFSLASYM